MSTNKYSYIPTEFGRTWVASRHEARRGTHVPIAYVDINDGNDYDAKVFAQIMYWHEPNMETGESRLRRKDDGLYWLTKNHADWFAETRIRKATVRKCLSRLQNRDLIVYQLGGDKGNPTPEIRVNWEEFERRMKLWMEHGHNTLGEEDYEKSLMIYLRKPSDEAMSTLWAWLIQLFREEALSTLQQDIPSDTTGHTPCPDISDPLIHEDIPLIPQVISNTETTSEIVETVEIEKTILSPVGEGMGAQSTSGESKPFEEFVETLNLDEDETPAEPDETTLLQYAVRGYFDLKVPVKPPDYSHQNMLIGFFTGKMNPKSKQKTWLAAQFDDEPFTAAEIIGFASWWENKYENANLPSKPDSIREKAVLFRAAKGHDKYVANGRTWLLQKIEKDKPKPAPKPDEPVPEIDVERNSRLLDGWLSDLTAIAEKQANG